MVIWPNPLIHLKPLHLKWLLSIGFDHIEMYHPKLVGLEHFMKSCISRNTDSVQYSARTNIPFQLQTHISEKCNIEWGGSSTRVVYEKLCGHEEQYDAVQEDSLLEISE